MVLPTPGLLTTVAVTPIKRCSCRIFCTVRAVRSMPPPGPTPTTISTLRVGCQTPCAKATGAVAASVSIKTRQRDRDSTMGTSVASGRPLALESTGISPGQPEGNAVASKRLSLMGPRHGISAGHYLAAHAGFEVLEAGGNAIDAGVAAGIAIDVLQTDKVNFGGVAPQIIYTA